MMIFLIFNLMINWWQSDASSAIYISSTILFSNFKSIASTFTESWSSRHSTCPHVIRSIQQCVFVIYEYKVSELTKGRVELSSHSSQQYKKKCGADRKWFWKRKLWWSSMQVQSGIYAVRLCIIFSSTSLAQVSLKSSSHETKIMMQSSVA